MMNSDDELTMESPSSTVSHTNSLKIKRTRLTFPFGACRVCSDSATGIHYGIATCEGCKGFFKRSILRKEKYRCYFDNSCIVNVTNRNRCKACRFRRCLTEGMSVDGVKMGRIPKLVKERALREQREQEIRQEAVITVQTNQKFDNAHLRESSCSSLSDRSIENYDPNTMEINLQTQPIRKTNESTKNFRDNNDLLYNEQTIKDSSINLNQNQIETKYPTFLPDDFTLDETFGLTEHFKTPLSNETFQHIRTISNKLTQDKLNSFFQLTKDELKFIRYLRWSSYNIYVRYSKRVKQLETRMNQMIYQSIKKYPGDNATISQFLATVPKTLEVLVRSTVFYIQEIPGITNINSNDLHKIILHRSFDWFMLKYSCLLNDNGQCYFLSPDGFQYTRHWMNVLYGNDLTDFMFKFSQRFRQLNLDDKEISLILPLQICQPDQNLDDQETIRMLRNCYLYGLYEELSFKRGEQEGRIICSQILQVLDQLVLLNDLYEKNVGSRMLEA